MTLQERSSNIPIQLSQNCAIASIQVDLTPEVLLLFRKDLLDFAHSSGAQAVILDVSGVMIMDLEDFNAIREIMSMVKILGAFTIISGLNPGVVASIIELGAKVDDIDAVLNLDDAFVLANQKIMNRSNRKVDGL